MMEKGKSTDIDPRTDKWMWAVRLFKTRSQATEACRKGRVIIDNIPVKPSRIIKPGDILHIKRPPSVFQYRVKELVMNRQPARLVGNYIEDLTPEEEKEKSRHPNLLVYARRDRGTGRPTKKERRIIDKLENSG
jgi:ribosome-associated heat shock protein Hsp15